MRILLVLLWGCSDGEGLSATTDGGTWVVTLAAAPTGPGQHTLEVTVDPVAEAIEAVETVMPSMGHGGDAVVTGADAGLFTIDADVSMAGVWVLSGDVVDNDLRESFVLEFEVP